MQFDPQMERYAPEQQCPRRRLRESRATGIVEISRGVAGGRGISSNPDTVRADGFLPRPTTSTGRYAAETGSRQGMAERELTRLAKSITTMAKSIDAAYRGADEAPEDVEAVARILPVVEEVFTTCGERVGRGAVSSTARPAVRGTLQRCENSMSLIQSAVTAGLGDSQAGASESGIGSGTTVQRRTALAQQSMEILHEGMWRLQEEGIVEASRALKVVRSSLDRLERVSGGGHGKYVNVGGGAQYNNINEGKGTQTTTNNASSENRGSVFFGQSQTFHSGGGAGETGYGGGGDSRGGGGGRER